MKDLILRRDALMRNVPWWRRIRMVNGEPVDPYQVLRRVLRLVAPFIFGVIVAGCAFSGYWWAADIGSDRDLARIVREVLPGSSSWAEAELRHRLPIRQKAIGLFETAITAPNSPLPGEVGKLIGVNTERALSLRAEALGFMAEHLSRMPGADQKTSLDKLIAVAMAVSDPDIFRGLALLANLSPDEKRAMFGFEARGLQLYISMFQGLLAQQDSVETLRRRLLTESATAEGQRAELSRRLAKYGCEIGVMNRVYEQIQTPGFSCAVVDRLPACLMPKGRR